MPIELLEEKWSAFGWDTCRINGRNIEDIYLNLKKECFKPRVVIADTVKGKGISYMEGEASWHYGVMTGKQEEEAWKKVGGSGDR